MMMAQFGVAQSSWNFKAYKGTMGKDMGITLVLGKKDGQLMGYYQRDVYKTDVDLEGTIGSDGTVNLTEVNERGVKMSSFVGKLQNGSFEGKWVAMTGKTSIPVSFNASASSKKVNEFKPGHYVLVKSINKQMKEPMMDVNVDYLMLVGSKASSRTYESLNVNARTKARKEFRAAVDNIRSAGNTGTFTRNIESVYMSDKTLSWEVRFVEKAGSRSMKQGVNGMNIEMASRQNLELTDVFKSNSDYLTSLSEGCVATLEKDYAGVEFDKLGLAPKVNNFDNFCITKEGVKFIFSSTQLKLPSEKALDNPMVVVPFSKLSSFLVDSGAL